MRLRKTGVMTARKSGVLNAFFSKQTLASPFLQANKESAGEGMVDALLAKIQYEFPMIIGKMRKEELQPQPDIPQHHPPHFYLGSFLQ